MALNVQKPHLFDKDLVRVVQNLIDAVNDGMTNEEIKAGAGISHSKLLQRVTEEQIVGSSTTRVQHGLGVVPSFVTITMRSSGTIWEVKAPDKLYVYLKGSAPNSRCVVKVEG